MLSKLKKSNNRNSQGFTIIEVMIVLAIAGLIILIVLLAVPALKRNGRNTALKSDATSIVGAVSAFESNNDGLAPDTVSGTAPTITVTNAATAGSTTESAKVQTGTTVTLITTPPGGAAPFVPANTVDVLPKYKCNNTSNYTAATDVTSNTRGVVVLYPVEQASGASQTRCIDS